MPQFIYSYNEDFVGPTTVTVTTADAGYPGTNAVDQNPGVPVKIAGTTGSIVFDFTVATRIDIVSLIHHNITPGLGSVQWQANGTNSWGAPSLSQTLTIPVRFGDGHSQNPWMDLTTKAGYSIGGYRFWRLNFGVANSANISIGEIAMVSIKRQLLRGISWGSGREREFYGAYDRTDSGTDLGYGFGTKIRSIVAQTEPTDSEVDDLLYWIDSMRANQRACLIVPNTDVNDAWYVKWTEPVHAYTRDSANKNTYPITMREVSRGAIP